MSDNRTTEKRISEPLCGFIRHQSNRAYIDGGQARWLTKIADEIDAKHEQAIAATLGDVADTIESLRDSLNEVADKWAEAQIKAENYAHENMLLKCDNNTRWHELFGTPERAARTLYESTAECRCCVIREQCGYNLNKCVMYDHDALLEWLRGDCAVIDEPDAIRNELTDSGLLRGDV